MWSRIPDNREPATFTAKGGNRAEFRKKLDWAPVEHS
jgi:hypothetical protein